MNRETANKHISHPVKIGNTEIGNANPVAVQTMTNCSTADIKSCVGQIRRISAAGCSIVRLTTPTGKDARSLGELRQELTATGLKDIDIVADVHFSTEVALCAAKYADKIRINPGNYKDKDGAKLRELLQTCARERTSIRIGVNHGSLSEEIVSRWGDTPEGMVESAMRFLRVCMQESFSDVVVSMKSSNVRTMVAAYRLLVRHMRTEGMTFPLHLGVTEAGDGTEGRVKSAVGIGTLLQEGIGDTIRVSLTEDPEYEIPVAKEIIRYADLCRDYTDGLVPAHRQEPGNSIYRRRMSVGCGNMGNGKIPLLWTELDGLALAAVENNEAVVLHMDIPGAAFYWSCAIKEMDSRGDNRPVVLSRHYPLLSEEEFMIQCSMDFGPLLLEGLADGVKVTVAQASIPQDKIDGILLTVMQAARARMSRTEYIACPGCGRTLFDLQNTLKNIKSRTSHLKHLKIGVMGCIVNGPGEMADADYGYVGAGPEKVTIYKGKNVLAKNIDTAEAVDALIGIIKDNGDWVEPETGSAG